MLNLGLSLVPVALPTVVLTVVVVVVDAP